MGILTSGGDCAGLNAAIRAVFKHAIVDFGAEVIGIERGTRGLMDRPVAARAIERTLFTGELLRQCGTVVGAVNSGDPFAYPEPDGTTRDRSADVLDGLADLRLDALIAIGGDGSLRILKRLSDLGGPPLIAIPNTIDNDVPGTDLCIGYHTAVATAVETLDRLQPKAPTSAAPMAWPGAGSAI
ncbi:MAG: 6-phosphofructokinase [Rhodospirillaceae bacterium]